MSSMRGVLLALYPICTIILAFSTSDVRSLRTHGTDREQLVDRRVLVARARHVETNPAVVVPLSDSLGVPRSADIGTRCHSSREMAANVSRAREHRQTAGYSGVAAKEAAECKGPYLHDQFTCLACGCLSGGRGAQGNARRIVAVTPVAAARAFTPGSASPVAA